MKPPTAAERLADADPNGCLRCCVAAMLEVPLDRVPRFVEDWSKECDPNCDQIASRKFVDYLGELGLVPVTISIGGRDDADLKMPIVRSRMLHVRCGYTPAGVSHAVLFRGDEMVYDCNGGSEAAFFPDAIGNYLGILIVPVDPCYWAFACPSVRNSYTVEEIITQADREALRPADDLVDGTMAPVKPGDVII